MARYIDADALYEKLYPLDLVDKRLYTINAKAVADAIAKIPTADVVPRVELDAMRGAANSYKMHYENAKAEVAREIFDEIDSVLCKFAYPSLTAIGTVNVITAEGFHVRNSDYNAIKKKYTELMGEQEDG